MTTETVKGVGAFLVCALVAVSIGILSWASAMFAAAATAGTL